MPLRGVLISKMKVFVFGANGMLGNYIKSYLLQQYDVIPLTRYDYDLEYLSIDSLERFILDRRLIKGDIIVNCAGVIPQSSKQRDINTRLYFIINSIFPIVLSMLCKKYGLKMIHITTDCVYSGRKGNYNEDSLHDETNDYGLSKSLGDMSSCTIIRTSIIGEEIKNERSLLEWIRFNAGKEINGFVNHHWNGVTCLQLAKVIENIIKNNKYWEGVRHIFSPRAVSKYELLKIINDIYELNITINKYETQTVDKTITSLYDKSFDIPDLSVQIDEMKSYKLE